MDAWTCPSCGSTATTPYCGRCGRLDLNATPVRGKVAVERTRSFLGRTLSSLSALLSPPGRLTRDWIRGRRVGYLTPISLFLWMNVAFFLIQSASGLGILTWPPRIHLSDDSISWLTTWLLAHRKPGATAENSGYAQIFDALEAVHAKSLVIVMVPAFAVVAGALTLDRREPSVTCSRSPPISLRLRCCGFHCCSRSPRSCFVSWSPTGSRSSITPWT